MDINYSFGYWIRRRRKALDLTQDELARQVVCTLSTIKKIEADERRPSRLMAERLADSLQIPPAERDTFIKVACGIHSPGRLAVESEPIAASPPVERLTNLPVPATRLIGRVEQITEISALLHQHGVRMLTLTGPAGVGKTRLATALAMDLFPEFSDGTWLVDLAPLSNPALVAQTVASALNIHANKGKTSLDLLTSYLRNKHLLLVLDNCEHLLDACANLVHALLSACPRLVILGTSREPLNIPEEFTWVVPPLSLPDLKARPSLEELAQSEAVSLFLECAGHVQPFFKLEEYNAPAIAQICCRLDGLPLAIELAAARARVLSPEQIRSKLDDAMQLLQGGYRTSDTRQQTMLAAVEWSYNTLSALEQVLLRRLSVFAGGWTLEAAEAVCPVDECLPDTGYLALSPMLKQEDVLPLLTKLVNKSILTAVREQDQVMRYVVLETIRQYAAEKLLEAGETETVRQRHLEYFVGWVELISSELSGPQQIAWLKTLDLELENMRWGLTWGLNCEPELGLRLATALYRYWRVRNLLAEGMEWLTSLLNQPDNQAPTLSRARALGVLSSLGFFIAPNPEIWAEESLAISESQHDEAARAFALWMLGTIQYIRYEDFDQGRQRLAASLEAYRAIGNRWGMAQVYYHLANLAIYQGDALTQREDLERCLVLYREVGDLRGIAATLDNLASATADIDADLRTAQKQVEEALGIYRLLDARASMHNALYVYAYILSWQGVYPLAKQVLQERLEIVQHSGSALNIVLAEVLLAGLDRLSGRAEQAVTILEDSLWRMKTADQRQVQGWHYSRTLRELAYILARRGDATRARNLLQEAFAATDMPEERALQLHCRGSLALVEKDGTTALADFRKSLEICQGSHFKLSSILAMEGISGALCQLSSARQATRLLSSAAAFRDRIGAPVSPWDRPVYEDLRIALKQQISEITFSEAWNDGQAMPFDRAIDVALAL